DDDFPSRLFLAAVPEVRTEQQQPRELTLAPGGRLQRNCIEARDLPQDLLQLPLELERTLRRVVLDQRMQARESGQPDDPLVDARVVLHGAAAERIEAGVDPEVARRELREVPEHLGLRELRQTRRPLPPQLLRHLGNRQTVGPRNADAAPARTRLLVDELHESASTSSSISSTVRCSVTATSNVS